MRSTPSYEKEFLWGLLGLILLGGLFLREVLAMEGIPVARDMQLFFVPQKHLLWTALQEGRVPLWSELIGAGMPLLANFQSGVFYPPNWLYAVFPFFETFNAILVLHFLLGGLSTYLLCRKLEFTAAASWVGAVIFMLGGYFVSLTNLLNVLQTAAWAPALCLVTLRHLERGGVGSFAGLVCAYLLAFLAGEPLTFVMASMVAFGLVAVRAWTEGDAPRAVGKLAAALGLAALIVAGVAMIQILPTLEYVAESTRGSGLSVGQAGRYSLHPGRLANLVVPDPHADPIFRFGQATQFTSIQPWLFSVYLGVVTLALVYFAGRDRERRGEVVFWSGVGLAGLVGALGPHTPVFGWMLEHVPGFAAFRFPERFLFLTAFAVSLLGAHGLTMVGRKRNALRADGVAALAALGLGLSLKSLWLGGREWAYSYSAEHLADRPFFQNFDFAYEAWGGSLDRVLILLVLTIVLIGLYRRDLLRRSTLMLGLLGLVAADLWTAHRHLTPVADRSFYETAPDITRTLPLEDVRRTYRYQASPFDENVTRPYAPEDAVLGVRKWYWQQSILPNLGQYWKILSLDSVDAIHLRRRIDENRFYEILRDRDRWRLLRLGSVKWIYSPLDFDPELYGSRIPLDSLPGSLYSMADPLPRAYLAEGARFADSAIETLNLALRQDFRPAREVALLDEGRSGAEDVFDEYESGPTPRLVGEREPDPNRDGSERKRSTMTGAGKDVRVGAPIAAGAEEGSGAAIVADTGEEIRVRISTPSPAFLVVTDTHYPGWTAEVDGAERPVLLANYFYRAVPVLPGEEEVVFRYASASYETGKRISLATLLLASVGFGLGWWRGRGKVPPDSESA